MNSWFQNHPARNEHQFPSMRSLIEIMVGSPNNIEVRFRRNGMEMLATELRYKAKLENREEVAA